MADTAYVIPADAMDIRVTTYKLTNFPATGTFMSIEKVSPNSTVVDGRHGTATYVRNNSKLHRVTLNIMQGHPDDAFLMAAIQLLRRSDAVLSFSFISKATKYLSTSIDIENSPTREYAADGSPVVAYTLTGIFPVDVVGAWTQPPVATEEQIVSLIPVV